jgi:multisubunit Na+/H+ antiporter MnhC subunit
MHIAAFIVLISPLGRKAGQWIKSPKTATITAGFAILAFVGTMMQHLTGGLVYEAIIGYLAGSPPSSFVSVWNFVFYIYPFERLALIIGAVIVGVPVTRVLLKTFFHTDEKKEKVTYPKPVQETSE